MTSTVIVRAHCAKEKVVEVEITDKGTLVEGFVLRDGQTAERYIYEDKEIRVREAMDETKSVD